MSRYVILSAGPVRSPECLREYLQPDDIYVAADGGWRLAQRLGVVPTALIGDFDSGNLPDDLPVGVTVRHLPTRKDVTDTVAAVDFALERGADSILLLGCTGGRLDHLLANIQLLVRLTKRGCRAEMADEQNRITAAVAPFAPICRADYKLSLFAFDRPVRQLCITGAVYELHDYDLLPDDSLCISNELMPDTHISFAEGILLVVYAKD